MPVPWWCCLLRSSSGPGSSRVGEMPRWSDSLVFRTQDPEPKRVELFSSMEKGQRSKKSLLGPCLAATVRAEWYG
jgi:hypothetical protein